MRAKISHDRQVYFNVYKRETHPNEYCPQANPTSVSFPSGNSSSPD
jgi:hypothetical protein